MSTIDERLNTVMLSMIQRRAPSAELADFDRPIYDLDMDSLDVVDLANALEKEFSVQADLEQVSECVKPSDIKAYFEALIGTE